MHKKKSSDFTDSVTSSSSVSANPRNQKVIASRFMSPAPTSSSSSLADHITNDRIRDKDHRKPTSAFSLTRQKSSKNDANNASSKENHRPSLATSLRNIAKLASSSSSPSTAISSPSSSSSSWAKKQNSNDTLCIDQARLSLDENALYKKSLSSSRRNHPDYYSNVSNSVESEPGYFNSPSRTTSSKKLGREVPSKYMVMTTDAAASFDESMLAATTTNNKNTMIQKSSSIKRANSLINGYKSSMSQWALSPGRSGSPPMCVDKKDKLPSSFSSLRPQKNNKSVEKILSMGFDLFRTKKSSSSSSSNTFGGNSSNSEDVHLLRLLDNRLLQWRFANARAQVVNENVSQTVQSNLICALDGLTKLRNSVMQKKIQLEREKLKMKLNLVLRSQMKLLGTWGAMERQHMAEIVAMKQCLHSAVCKVPLLEGATVDIQSAFIAQRQASDLTASINSMLTSFSLQASKTAELVSELAEVVAQEKLLLEEFYYLFHAIRVLELRERSLKFSLIQLQC